MACHRFVDARNHRWPIIVAATNEKFSLEAPQSLLFGIHSPYLLLRLFTFSSIVTRSSQLYFAFCREKGAAVRRTISYAKSRLSSKVFLLDRCVAPAIVLYRHIVGIEDKGGLLHADFFQSHLGGIFYLRAFLRLITRPYRQHIRELFSPFNLWK